ncbi:hypothetical protein KBI33_00840 [Candidatus Shapirobacteria bacterium]|nr:hypothetical protein [Candidatus Shapirobacteria bacterium]
MEKKTRQQFFLALVFASVIAINLIENIPLIKFQNFSFHTDIARDFFLIKDVVDSKKPSLVGPRVGEISGLFHGPAWTYLNLPVFLIFKGDPIAQNYFYLALTLIAEMILFFVTKKIFGTQAAAVSIVIYALKINDWVGNFFHPFGAIIFSPLFFYFFYQIGKEKTSKKINFLFLGLFGGILAQFQLGFGLPLIIIAGVKIFFQFLKKEIHLSETGLFLLGLIISLANFIIFDFRHDFLQGKAVWSFLHQLGRSKLNLAVLIKNRIEIMTYSGLGFFKGAWSFLLLIIFLSVLVILSRKNKEKVYQDFLFLFLGFWILTGVNFGKLQSYHYWALIPISIMIISSLTKFFPKKTPFIIIFCLALNANLFIKNFSLLRQTPEDLHLDQSSWRFISQAARTIFQDAENDFGYFAYTPDLYSYSPRYAMEYWNQFYPYQAHAFEKKPVTYLLIFSPPQDKPWLEGSWWAKNQVNVKKDPEKTMAFDNDFRIEKYLLSEEEIKIPSDPNLINSTYFR